MRGAPCAARSAAIKVENFDEWRRAAHKPRRRRPARPSSPRDVGRREVAAVDAVDADAVAPAIREAAAQVERVRQLVRHLAAAHPTPSARARAQVDAARRAAEPRASTAPGGPRRTRRRRASRHRRPSHPSAPQCAEHRWPTIGAGAQPGGMSEAGACARPQRAIARRPFDGADGAALGFAAAAAAGGPRARAAQAVVVEGAARRRRVLGPPGWGGGLGASTAVLRAAAATASRDPDRTSKRATGWRRRSRSSRCCR